MSEKENLNEEQLNSEATEPVEGDEAKTLEEMTREELNNYASELGIPEEVAQGQKTNGALISMIRFFESQAQQTKALEEKVEALEEDGGADVDDPALKTRKIQQEDGTIVVKKAVKDDERSDTKKYNSKKDLMKAKLAKQPKVQIMVPLEFGEKRGTTLPVQLNGYRLNILKGVMVRVPEQIAQVIKEAYDMEAQAGEQFLLDRTKIDETTGQRVNVADALTY